MQGCRLAAATTSEFKHNDPVGWTEAHRGQIMRALYTLLLGNPFLRTPMGTEASTRFKIWWRMCGSAVENAAKQHTQWRKNEIAALERVFPPDRDDQWRQRRADIDSGIPSAQPKAIDFKELFLAQEDDDEESASLADVLAGMAAKQWTNSARGNVQPQANDIAKLINNPGSDYLAEADQQLAVTLREFLFPKAATGQVMSAKSVSKQLGKHVGEPVKRGEQTLLLRKTADTHAKILSYSVEVR